MRPTSSTRSSGMETSLVARQEGWMKRFGDPGFVRYAALSRILALYVGMLATPRFFPLRFGELADFASRQIREIQARHPSSIGWVPQIAGPLVSQIELFEAEARAWDARVRAAKGPGKDAGQFDRLLSVALGAFAAPGAAFGRGCRLWGPSPETGCGAAALPALEEAVGRHEQAAAAKEVGRLAAAFARARNQLVLANRVAEGARRSPRPTPGISRPPRGRWEAPPR